jgi:hypothetical protein
MPNLNLPTRRVGMRLIVLVALLASVKSFSQDHRISISPSYNQPLGDLKWAYSSGFGAKLSYSAFHSRRNHTDKLKTISLGYTKFNPIADTLYYVADGGGQGANGNGAVVGTAVYSPFKLYHFEGSLGWILPLGEKLSIVPIIGIGGFYGKRTIEVEDAVSGSYGVDEVMQWATLTPQVGLEYKVTEVISVSPFFAWSLMVQAGSTDTASYAYNENTGLLHYYYSTGVSLNFSF